jgi:adenosylmethionine-8-amino-7-oxononanoate aminotransferase
VQSAVFCRHVRDPLETVIRGASCWRAWNSLPTARREPLPTDARVTERIVAGARRRGVMIIPGIKNANYGKGGDHIQITPPYAISQAEIDIVVDVLDEVIGEVAGTL